MTGFYEYDNGIRFPKRAGNYFTSRTAVKLPRKSCTMG
jgi:hypothetical protein